MNETKHADSRRAETTDIYLPAVAIPSSPSRIEEVLDDLLDLHGIVPIPDTYNE
jgi:hypothetical protein